MAPESVFGPLAKAFKIIIVSTSRRNLHYFPACSCYAACCGALQHQRCDVHYRNCNASSCAVCRQPVTTLESCLLALRCRRGRGSLWLGRVLIRMLLTSPTAIM